MAAAVWLICFGAVARAQDFASRAVEWREVAWPFLRDAWPNGRAFDCEGAACAKRLSIYMRVKNGFCDCTRGVADDDEIDRVGDVVLLAPDFRPLAASEPRDLAGMSGRARLYETIEKAPRPAASLAGGRDCNAFVALLLASGAISRADIDVAAAFINSAAVSRWIARAQGGG